MDFNDYTALLFLIILPSALIPSILLRYKKLQDGFLGFAFRWGGRIRLPCLPSRFPEHGF